MFLAVVEPHSRNYTIKRRLVAFWCADHGQFATVKKNQATTDAFANALRTLRERRGMSGPTLVLRLYDHGIETSAQSISSWEKGRYAPADRETVAALDAALDGDGQLLALLNYTATPLEERLAAIEARLDALENPSSAKRSGLTVVGDEDRIAASGRKPARGKNRPKGKGKPRRTGPEEPAE